MSKRRFIIPTLILFVFLLGTTMVEAAPKKQQTKQAIKEYMEEIKAFKEYVFDDVYYMFFDVTGDSIPEAVILGYTDDKNDYDVLDILQYYNGSIRNILYTEIYELKELTFMPKKGAVELMSAIETAAAVEDLVFKNGKFAMIAELFIDRTAQKEEKTSKKKKAANSAQSLYYFDGNGNTITEKQYKKLISPLMNTKRITVHVSEFKAA